MSVSENAALKRRILPVGEPMSVGLKESVGGGDLGLPSSVRFLVETLRNFRADRRNFRGGVEGSNGVKGGDSSGTKVP